MNYPDLDNRRSLPIYNNIPSNQPQRNSYMPPINQNNFDNFENLNINNLLNNNQNNNGSFNKNKLYNIKENNSFIYIHNNNQNCTIKLEKSFDNKIIIVDNENEYRNIYSIKDFQADSIIGIFDLNDNKYLGFVNSSTEIKYFMDSYFYCINSIELLKISNNKESLSDINLIKNIKNLFSTGNFYYSNNYDISLSLKFQSKINNSSNNTNNINSKYLINFSLLKDFWDNNIPDFFFSPIIFGYMGFQNDIYLNEAIHLDIIIIERFFNKNLIINNDIPGYIKQIELITIFKNKFNKNLDKVFSTVFYISSESMQKINKFLPFKTILIDEFNLYKNIICIINNINKKDDNSKINDVISKFNKNTLNNKINLIDFTSDWDKKLYFDTTYDSNKYIDYYYNNLNETIQENVFWFIDINNSFSNDDICFNAMIRIMYNVIQKQMNFIGLNINIGLFNQNMSIVCNKFIEITMKYQNDIIDRKRPLLRDNRDKNQEVIDKILSYKDNYRQNNNNINLNDNLINNDNKNNINADKIKLLCTTWNVGGIQSKNYNISELFKKNIFYNENKSPDIIVVAIQEIVKLNISNILSLGSNQENVKIWTQNIMSTLKNIFPQAKYMQIKTLNLVGIFILILIKEDLKDDIFLLDHNQTKKGMHGTLGNKGFFTITMQCYDKIISIGSGHFEAGKGKNNERINTLTQLLNKPLNIQEDDSKTFKEADYWIILGDLNFRIELSYEDAISYIQEKNYDVLYAMDQFSSALQNNEFLKKYINEKKINFDPTYKYEKESNEYAYDEDKIRVPAYTDRIFFCKNQGIKMLTYDCIKTLRFSDHRPVCGAFEIDVDKNKKGIYKKNYYSEKQNKKSKFFDIDIEINIKRDMFNNYIPEKNDNEDNNIKDVNPMINSNNNNYNYNYNNNNNFNNNYNNNNYNNFNNNSFNNNIGNNFNQANFNYNNNFNNQNNFRFSYNNSFNMNNNNFSLNNNMINNNPNNFNNLHNSMNNSNNHFINQNYNNLYMSQNNGSNFPNNNFNMQNNINNNNANNQNDTRNSLNRNNNFI